MDEFSIVSFKYGLDTRRDVLTSQPGTLVVCENAHVNPGGELEKRKAFDAYKNVAILDGNGDAGTFGLEVTDAGLVVFGSALPFGTTPSQSQPVLVSAMPSGVTYQQLKHPSLVNDLTENYNRIYHRITAIKFSENFLGNAFVSALFADGRAFLYYNGTLIQQSANGLVMEGRIALADLANDLDRQIDSIPNWMAYPNEKGDALSVESIVRAGTTATVTLTAHGYSNGDSIEIIGATASEYNGIFVISNVTTNTFDYTLVGAPVSPAAPATGILAVKRFATQNGAVLVQSPPFDMFSALPEDTSTSGAIGDKLITHDGTATNGVQAWAGFQITVNAGSFTLTAPQQSTAQSPTYDLCGGATAAAASAKLTADFIAACVNDLTFITGYSAIANGDNVFVFAPISFGVFVLNLTVTPAGGGAVGAATTTPAGIFAVFAPNPLQVVKLVAAPSPQPIYGIVASSHVSVNRGTAPFTYVTTEATLGSSGGITINPGSATTADPSFSKFFHGDDGASGTFKCVVTDSLNATYMALINVDFSCVVV